MHPQKKFKRRPGEFLALSLPSGGYGYGRVLHKLMAFYDLRTDELVDMDRVAASNILFVTGVHVTAISNRGWQSIGVRPLEDEFQQDRKFFRKNPSGHGFLIYISKPTPPNAYEEIRASAEE